MVACALSQRCPCALSHRDALPVPRRRFGWLVPAAEAWLDLPNLTVLREPRGCAAGEARRLVRFGVSSSPGSSPPLGCRFR